MLARNARFACSTSQALPHRVKRCSPRTSHRCAALPNPFAKAAAGGAPPQMPNMSPEQMKAMQEAMARPEVQAEVQGMMAAMQNPGLQAKMAALKDDPDMAPMFDDIKKNGAAAIMKYYNDPEWLAKLSSKIGNPMAGGVAGPPPPPVAPAAADIKNLRDAAKYGDEEAVEDYIAINKDVNEADSEGRTPLHFAAGTNHAGIVQMLLDAGAKLDVVDSKQNTPLHYAAGYGRAQLAAMLVKAGADLKAKNSMGKTPLELVKGVPNNPINQDQEVLKAWVPRAEFGVDEEELSCHETTL